MAKERDLADQIFSPRDFSRTLSYREFLSSLSLALLLLALCAVVDYYDNEDWIANNESAIKWTLICVLLPVNHIFYKVEHKRSNNFIGRNFHDYIFIFLFVVLHKLRLFLYGLGLSIGIEGVGGAIVLLLVFIIMVMLFELAVAILKRGLNFLRWQIL